MIAIQYALNIIIHFFKSREFLVKKDYEYFEAALPELLHFVKIFMNHQNSNSQTEVNLCDYFRDDPGYIRFNTANKSSHPIPYDNHLEFECIYPSPQTASFDAKTQVVTEPINLQISFENIHVTM